MAPGFKTLFMHLKHYLCTLNTIYALKTTNIFKYTVFVDLSFFIFAFYETVFYATLS